MSDVTNPGSVSVADEVEGNPDPNGGTSQAVPEQDGDLVSAEAQGYPPAPVDAEVFPTPVEVEVGPDVPLLPVLSDTVPHAAEVYVDEQSLGLGGMVPVDPLDPSKGLNFLSPAEFTVAGPTISVQTNRAEDTAALVTVAAVLDADHLPAPAGAATTRYHLVVATPPVLTSFFVSLLGRQVVFALDTLTPGDQGAARVITGYGGNFVVVDRDDESVSNGDVPQLALPQAGDTFVVQTYREGSEDVSSTGDAPVDVFVLPPPPSFVPSPAQALLDRGDVDVSTGPQPGAPIVSSGTPAPTAITVEVADQSLVVGLPVNVFA